MLRQQTYYHTLFYLNKKECFKIAQDLSQCCIVLGSGQTQACTVFHCARARAETGLYSVSPFLFHKSTQVRAVRIFWFITIDTTCWKNKRKRTCFYYNIKHVLRLSLVKHNTFTNIIRLKAYNIKPKCYWYRNHSNVN